MKVVENQVSLGDELVKRMKKQMDMELMAAEDDDDDSDYDDADAGMLVSFFFSCIHSGTVEDHT
jgi:hypothetical protein